jgi:hypothetical protein
MPTDEVHRLDTALAAADTELVAVGGVTDAGLDAVGGLAAWSSWVPFAEALAVAPRSPGVYMARAADQAVVYIGMAGERRGSGLRGRLSVYQSGKALASGLGEAVFDRALADADWLRERLGEVEAGHPARAKKWGRLAFERAGLQIRWATVDDRSAAVTLERACLDALSSSELWNRLR